MKIWKTFTYIHRSVSPQGEVAVFRYIDLSYERFVHKFSAQHDPYLVRTAIPLKAHDQ